MSTIEAMAEHVQ